MNHQIDIIIIGAGVSGSFIAKELTEKGLNVLQLEAGSSFNKKTYPRNSLDAMSALYWSGGVEFNTDSSLGLLRPKVVGGGSIVNQALVDRFDQDALDSWYDQTRIHFMSDSFFEPWYNKAESELSIQEIPKENWNKNALIFKEGFDKNNYLWSPLRRAQSDCKYHEGNDCIACLSGCSLDSKQSMPVTTLKKALQNGLTLISDFEVLQIKDHKSHISVTGRDTKTLEEKTFQAKKCVLASGAIGNSKLLLQSEFQNNLPFLGKGFYTHPQFMNFALYKDRIDAHKGPLQSLKSNDPTFRRRGFKLENVSAPAMDISVLLPSFGKSHYELMRNINHYACIEIAIRDTEAGRISVNKNGKVIIQKKLNDEDHFRKNQGLDTVKKIFRSTGAKKIIEGSMAIGLHLMGGCPLGKDPKDSVTNEQFQLHGHPNIYCADSSIFPNAPGINPSLTIMALSLMASHQILKESQHV